MKSLDEAQAVQSGYEPPVICTPEELLKEWFMAIDAIIAEVRQAREELAKRFNYDLQAIIRDARDRQAASGRKVVSFPPRPARKAGDSQAPERPLEHAVQG
jgi:hypothetical protein